MKNVYLRWQGPYDIHAVDRFHQDMDYGVYQIYGNHPVYGSGVLLYIGKAERQTFATRLQQHDLVDWTEDPCNLEIYLGRLMGTEQPSIDVWEDQISLAECLLIFAHAPAYNAQGMSEAPSKAEGWRVFNFGSYRSLAPECSGERWFSLLTKAEKFEVYRMNGRT